MRLCIGFEDHRYGRERICTYIVAEFGEIAAVAVWRTFRKAAVKNANPTRNLGLRKRMKEERPAFYCRYSQCTPT